MNPGAETATPAGFWGLSKPERSFKSSVAHKVIRPLEIALATAWMCKLLLHVHRAASDG